MRSWRIGSIGTVPLYLDRFWPVGVLLLASIYFSGLTGAGLPTDRALIQAIILTLGLFLSVLVHELSHAWAGRLLKRPPESITLTLWGGYTSFRGPERGPGVLALVSVAGPISNLALAFLIDRLIVFGVGMGWTQMALLAPLSLVNFLMGLFNLAPGLPMDGGHIVHAIAWRLSGNRDRGMLIAAWGGVVLAALVAAWALYTMIGAGGFGGGNFWLLIIAFILWDGAQRSLRTARARLSVAKLDLQRTMTEVPVLSPTAPLDVVPPVGAVLADRGRIVGVVLPQDRVDAPGLTAANVSRVVPSSAIVTQRYGADAAAQVSGAARASDVIVHVDGQRAWIGRVPDLARAIEAEGRRAGDDAGRGARCSAR